ncbi:hypothetical protein [Streptomyces sp. NRRL F-5053]|uniref:hypothetical protein n=1 Tax=Streptomyces sp. NRRL F-5053 TaxID=1463854 RepID=UPI0004CB0DC3|nr:hypothetical protein [Streptomyces sp. NRRL F-5053]
MLWSVVGHQPPAVAVHAAHPQDPAPSGLLAACLAHDEEFARLWDERNVVAGGRWPVAGGRRPGAAGRTPSRGRGAALHFEVLVPLQNPDQRLMLCRAADDETQAALDGLCAR